MTHYQTELGPKGMLPCGFIMFQELSTSRGSSGAAKKVYLRNVRLRGEIAAGKVSSERGDHKGFEDTRSVAIDAERE